MGKHQRKIEAALAARQAATPKLPGYHVPGSRNKRKTGYGRSSK